MYIFFCSAQSNRSTWLKINLSFRWRRWQRWTWAITEWLPFPDSPSLISTSTYQTNNLSSDRTRLLSHVPLTSFECSWYLFYKDTPFRTLKKTLESTRPWYSNNNNIILQFSICSLTQLDLSHNYLRAVTSELVGGLTSLESLDLTDNDISLVEPGALTNLPKLIHLSLTGKQ